jgi:glycosyltransferase involved in cell wall biosynthesis
MRIAIFSDAYWPRVNGVTVSVDSYSRSLIKAGHEVLVICSSYPEGIDGTSSFHFDREAEEGGAKIVRVPSMPAFVKKEDRLAKFTKWHWVFRQVESFKPEIIHINTEFVIAEIGFLYARAHNLPAIYTFHTMWEDYGPNYFPMLPIFFIKFIARSIIKTILFQSYRVIVPTTQIDEVVHAYNHRIKTSLLPTGIEPELFDHTDEEGEIFREKLEGSFPKLKGKRILLFAGRIVKEKNLGFLLNILPEILKKHPDVVLLFAGSGPDLDYFREEAKEKGLEDNCEFSGYVERKYLALIYRVSEVFLFPSLTDTQGLVTIEAMFSGTPVVAIGALGTLMVMGGDNGGFMVENDESEFTERVLELLGDKDLWSRKSEEARLHARSWSIEELTKKLADIYKATTEAYRKDYGKSRMPVWELLMDKRWWDINNKIFKKRTRLIWQGMRSKLTP